MDKKQACEFCGYPPGAKYSSDSDGSFMGYLFIDDSNVIFRVDYDFYSVCVYDSHEEGFRYRVCIVDSGSGGSLAILLMTFGNKKYAIRAARKIGRLIQMLADGK